MHPPCLWFTGLPGAGKTTLARALAAELEALGTSVVVLDGDELRRTISADLGFTPDDRDRHLERVEDLALEAVRAGKVVVVACISPSAAQRRRARAKLDSFALVHVDCPLAICVERDPKGMYRRALAGELQNFTGISAPYDVPSAPLDPPDLHLSTVEPLADCLTALRAFLADRGHP